MKTKGGRGLPATGTVKGGMVSAKKMQVNRMGAPDDPAQMKKPMPIAFKKKKAGKGAKTGKNKGGLKVQGAGNLQRNPILGVFPGDGSGPDDDGY